jgi:hypothetical protein
MLNFEFQQQLHQPHQFLTGGFFYCLLFSQYSVNQCRFSILGDNMNAITTSNKLQPVSAKATELIAAGYVWNDTYGLWFGGEGFAHVLNADGTPADENSTLSKKYGMLAYQYGGMKLPLQVLKSAAGFYIGTTEAEGELKGAPNSRESERYWQKALEAQAALDSGDWVQKLYL